MGQTHPRAKRVCASPDCINLILLRSGHRFCSGCRDRVSKSACPAKVPYRKLRANARRRGISFSLTFSQFEEFCAKTGYLERVGKSADSLSIDRIKSDRGYEEGNIQVLTLAENTAKNNREIAAKYEEKDPF